MKVSRNGLNGGGRDSRLSEFLELFERKMNEWKMGPDPPNFSDEFISRCVEYAGKIDPRLLPFSLEGAADELVRYFLSKNDLPRPQWFVLVN